MASDSHPNDTTQRTLLSQGPLQPARRSACVVVIHGEGLGRRADIDDAPVLVGRSQEADLVIAHKSVSREHCRIWREGDGYRIRDLGATNATRLNDRRIDAESALADGDQVTVGESILKFISQDSVEARYHEEIYQLATHDALTELYNRRHFIEMADKEIARAMRHSRPLSLCIVDVDLFKPVNDRYGHISGDEVLRQIAALLRRHARSDDLAARIGGEEFAVILPNCPPAFGQTVAERLRAKVEGKVVAVGPSQHLGVTVSVGGAYAPQWVRSSPTIWVERSDLQLYRAKSEGRNRTCIEPTPVSLVSAEEKGLLFGNTVSGDLE